MITKDESNMTRFTNLGGLDPAVNLLIDQGDRRQADAHLPRVERSRKKKERERAQKRKPHRINLDLPMDLKKRLETRQNLKGFRSVSWWRFCYMSHSTYWRANQSACGAIKLPPVVPSLSATWT
jgi:hypothetical protein